MAGLSERVNDWKAAGKGSLYQRIADDLCTRIHTGEWGVGGKLPGRQALAREYGVDLSTVQPAVNRLLGIGLLQAIDRKGTFVRRAVTAADYFAAEVAPVPISQNHHTPTSFAGSSIKPIAGVIMYGGYHPKEQGPDTGHWGNIIATSIERSFANCKGRTYFLDGNYMSFDDGTGQSLLPYFRERDVNVLIIVDIYGWLSSAPAALSLLEQCGLPVVIIGSEAIATRLPFVTYDQYDAGVAAVEHLVQVGYRNIMFFMPFQAYWVEERLKGIQAAIARFQGVQEALTIMQPPTIGSDFDYYRNYTDDDFYLHGNSEPTHTLLDEEEYAKQLLAYFHDHAHCGIIAPNDDIARAILLFAKRHGLTPGVDFGLVGFDDCWFTRTYGITTLRPPLEAMGSEAARLAELLLRHEQDTMHSKMRSHLIERASTHRLRT